MKITDDCIYLLAISKIKGYKEVPSYHLCRINGLKPGEVLPLKPYFCSESIICKNVTETEIVLEYHTFVDDGGLREVSHEAVLNRDNLLEYQFTFVDDTRYRKFSIVNFEERMREIREAAETGNDTAAQYFLGYCYYYGSNEVKIDEEEALKWLRQAAEGGYVEAQRMLGHILPNNEYEAYKWLMACGDTNEADHLMELHQMLQV